MRTPEEREAFLEKLHAEPQLLEIIMDEAEFYELQREMLDSPGKAPLSTGSDPRLVSVEVALRALDVAERALLKKFPCLAITHLNIIDFASAVLQSPFFLCEDLEG